MELRLCLGLGLCRGLIGVFSGPDLVAGLVCGAFDFRMDELEVSL